MNAALALARRGLGRVWPNPAVGCVLVRDGTVVGRGWTQPGGRPHAEAMALKRAGKEAQGATAYVTLEPCAHSGETPPCARLLAEAGVARVVYAIEDPDPRTNGKGAERLRADGVQVESGLMDYEAREVNGGFLKRVEKGKPLTALKLATSLDGRIALASGESRWITGKPARRRAHLLRAEYDAILVGVGTVAMDDPMLDCRLPGMEDRSPLRIIVDGSLRTPPNAKILSTADRLPTWILTHTKGVKTDFDPARLMRVKDTHDIPGILDFLGQQGLTRILIEGGTGIATSFLKAGMIDRVHWFRAPTLIGADGRPGIGDLELETLKAMPRFERLSQEQLGEDLLENLRSRP